MDIGLKKNDRVLVIHHWDCDGLCSAALIMRYLKEDSDDISILTMTGEIGKYYLTPRKIKKFESTHPDHIILCDYALPKPDILKLKDISGRLVIFDHHKQEEVQQAVHINPFLSDNVDSLMYPSTGWVINAHMCRPQELLAVLGAVGDQEDLIRNNDTVQKVLEENDLDFGEATEIVENIDSCYIAGDETGIRELTELLSGKAFEIKGLLDDKSLLYNRRKIKSAIRKLVEGVKNIDNNRKIVYVRYNSSYHIISNVTRELARMFPGHLVVVANDPGKGEANIYFRTRTGMDLRPVIRLALERGFNSGGKKEVAGVILPRKHVSRFISEAEGILGL